MSNYNGASAPISGSYASAPPQGGTYQDYQRQQIQRLTAQAQQQQPLTLVPQDTQQVAQMQDSFGPYVPYVPPAQSVPQNYGYTPSPVPVQLGDSTPRIAPPQREVTDVLPTAKYVPNAKTTRHSSRAMTGVSNPPPDDASLSTQNAQYRPQVDVQPQAGAAMQGQSYPILPATNPTSQSPDGYGQQYPQPGTVTRGASRRTTQTATKPPPSAPLNYPGVSQPLSGSGYPALGPPASVGTPPTDAELAASGVPPLRGGYNPAQPNQPLSQRQQTELDLAALEASYSGWVGGTGFGRYRSGTPGLDRLTDIESPFEASAVLGKTLRATVVAVPVFLNSGDDQYRQLYERHRDGSCPRHSIRCSAQHSRAAVLKRSRR